MYTSSVQTHDEYTHTQKLTREVESVTLAKLIKFSQIAIMFTPFHDHDSAMEEYLKIKLKDFLRSVHNDEETSEPNQMSTREWLSKLEPENRET